MRKLLLGIGLAILVLFLLVILTPLIAEGPLREHIERELNRRAEGYQVTIGGLDLHPLALALEVEDLTVTQRSRPTPPLAQVKRVHAKLWWSGFLRGEVIGDILVEEPRLQAMRPQAAEAMKEAKAPAAKEQRWQDRLLALRPVTLYFELRDGTITYRETPHAGRPLQVTHLTVTAGPLRNARSNPSEYPSEINLEGTLNETGQLQVRGRLALFADPHPAISADLTLRQIELSPLLPIASRYHVRLHQGRLTAVGHIEYAPWAAVAHFSQVSLENGVVNYIYEPPAPKPEKKVAKKAAEKAKQAAKRPAVLIRVDQAEVKDSEFGFVHAGVDPPYRVFLAHTHAEITNLSNRVTQGVVRIVLKGQFMGTGETEARGIFRPETTSPDFDLSARIEGTQVKMLNDLLRAYSKLDVAGGELSVYSQLTVKEGQVHGYVKPLIKNLDVYERQQERGKGALQKLYEGVTGGISQLLASPREEIATKTEVTGTLQTPQLDTWEAAGRLIQNAFFRVILPGFDRAVQPAS